MATLNDQAITDEELMTIWAMSPIWRAMTLAEKVEMSTEWTERRNYAQAHAEGNQ